jgi:RNA polymerase sigma-70 factor (ECF subfamily)
MGSDGPRGQEVPGDRRSAEVALVKLARDGDSEAFGELAGWYRPELRAHCYRMLGCVHDAEDALQEALVRAWRGLGGFEFRSSVRSWLYAIATNAALDITRHRSRRELPVDFSAGSAPGASLESPLTELPWLEPYPDQWLAPVPFASPEASYDQRESIELAFLMALQHLAPRQRAALLLREVAGFSAEEISGQLTMSVPSVNSALQRARAAVRDRLPAHSQQTELHQLGDRRIRELAARYADALERGDADTLISMLTEDASWSMPPIPTWFTGHSAIREFLNRYPLTLPWRHAPARANGQLAFGCYLPAPDGRGFVPAVIDVLTLRGDRIAAVTGFQVDPAVAPPPHGWVTGAEVFEHFGLPATLD